MKSKASRYFVLAIVLAALLFCSAAASDADFQIDNGRLVKYLGTDSNVTIPDGVTCIEPLAFANNETITEVQIPESVKIIQTLAFCDAKNLVYVNFPQGLLEIGRRAFEGCALTEAKIPDSVLLIEDDAFRNCTALIEVRLPETVMVCYDTFTNTPWEKANAVIISERMGGQPVGEKKYTTVASSRQPTQEGAFTLLGEMVVAYNGAGGNIIIPDGVTAIGEKVFYQNHTITGVTVPDSLKIICSSAFEGCTALKQVSPLPNGAHRIGRRAFANCSSLNAFNKSARTFAEFDAFIGTPYEHSEGEMLIRENMFSHTRSFKSVFPDVPSNQWYYNSVALAYETGLMDGKTTNRFEPNEKLSTAEAVKLAASMHASATNNTSYLAVSSPWYQTYYDYMDRYIVLYEPEWQEFDRPIRRDEFAYLIYNGLPNYIWEDYSEEQSEQFSDVYSLDNPDLPLKYALEINALSNAGICNGYSDGKFHPERTITRAEAAALAESAVNFAQKLK